MLQKSKLLHFNFGHFILSMIGSFLIIGALWILIFGLEKMGCPLLKVDTSKFLELGFFSLSNFSFIIFLSMIPFQTTEGELSPGFYARIVNRAWSHFGLYILMACCSVCFFVVGYGDAISERGLSQLYIAIIAAVILSIFLHRHQTLRYLYQPTIVYENLAKLATEENSEELWLDLYECTIKAIKANRINNARSFITLMSQVYLKMDQEKIPIHLQKDIRSLYEAAKDQHPIASAIEKNWYFICSDNKTSAEVPLVDTLNRLIQ